MCLLISSLTARFSNLSIQSKIHTVSTLSRSLCLTVILAIEPVQNGIFIGGQYKSQKQVDVNNWNIRKIAFAEDPGVFPLETFTISLDTMISVTWES